MNNVFITLNLALLTAVSLAWDIKSVFIIIAGIITCVIWGFFIDLIDAKPFISPHKCLSGERNILTSSFGLACRVIEALDMDVSKFYHGDYYLEELKTIEGK